MHRLSRVGRSRSHLDEGIELRLPSRLGYEKVAMDTVANLAGRMGFSQERVAALRSAIGEAVTNAIEHGNSGNTRALVRIQIAPGTDCIEVRVRDIGSKLLSPNRTSKRPELEHAMAGSDEGWGIWLIRQLVDEAEWTVSPSGGNEVRLVQYR